ncbi:exopolysaccharide biosynthesis protein [Chelativorans composti]|uniref:Exopolysaccharide biosynthesis protein n=1 Tax=Chelativorans composti TaxID=768533 RepID=A0ABW5DMW6_9HYPH
MNIHDSSMASHVPAQYYKTNKPRRLSTIVEELSARAIGPVSVQQIRDALGDRSFSTLLLFFAALNLLPLPPGTTLVLGLPLMLISMQMITGKRAVWLPRFLLTKSLTAEQFRKLAEKMLPRLRQLEEIVRPRYWPFSNPKTAERVIGIVALVLGTLVTLPIPFGNWFPALACALLGIALSERDGLMLIAAGITILISFAVLGAVFGTAGFMASMFFR